MCHTHTWCDRPPEGPLSWGKSWDERYFDTEALSENSGAKSEDYMLDTLYTLKLNPKFRFSEELWPGVVEWCSGCKKHRRVLFKGKEVLAKVQAPNEEKVHNEDMTIEEEVAAEVEEEVEATEVVEALDSAEEELFKEVMVGVEVVVVEKNMARSDSYTLRHSSTPALPLPSISPLLEAVGGQL